MSLKKIKIVDTNFAHAKYTTDFQESKFILWDREDINYGNEEIVFLTDNSIISHNMLKSKKIGILMEPRSINPTIYKWVESNYNKLETIFTYDEELIGMSDNIKFYPHCGCWIRPEDQKIYHKNKLTSIIASPKTQTNGHKLRHDSIKFIRDNGFDVDVYGRGYNPVDYKLDSLKEYAFSITIENSQINNYFTEKLMDCFMVGTVPIYWGCKGIGKYFNTDGMIIFNDVKDLTYQLERLSLDKYQSMKIAIKENFELSKEYLIAEDWLYNNTKIFK